MIVNAVSIWYHMMEHFVFMFQWSYVVLCIILYSLKSIILILPFNSVFYILSASFVITEWRQRRPKTIELGGGRTTKGLRGVRGEMRDIAMGHMVNKSDVRDPGEALHP